MRTKQAVGAASCAVAGVALGVTLEVYVFEGWPGWATLGVAIVFGYIGFWGLRPKDPDRGKTYWEKRLPELQEVAAHLRAVRLRETLIDPQHVTTLRHFAKTLDSLGINRPADGAVEGRLLYVWERYMYLFIDKVRLKEAANLRPVADELRTVLEKEQAAQKAFERKLGALEPEE